MKTRHARRLSRWLALPLALFALACAFLAPAPEGGGRAHARARTNARKRRAAPPQRQRREPRPEEPQPEEPAAESTVSGRVVYDDTSRPVRRARVLLLDQDGGRTEYNALTNARGEFRIDGVDAGSYFAFANVPGVLSPAEFMSVNDLPPSAPDFAEAHKLFEVIKVDGRQDVRVTVRARRGAALSGKVVYADGDPAVNLAVNLLRRGEGGRLTRYVPAGHLGAVLGLRTDDRGVFRVSGLPPGEYLVGVSEAAEHGERVPVGRGEDIPNAVEGLMKPKLLLTYYPSAVSAKEAAVVKVVAGDERGDVDITIPERNLRLVAGVVRSRRDKAPVPRARVAIFRKDDSEAAVADASLFYFAGESGANVTTADEEGRWAFNEIPEGAYTILVRPPDESEDDEADTADAAGARNSNSNLSGRTRANTSAHRPRPRRAVYTPAQRDVQVADGDLTAVAIEMADGGRISGVVKIEGEASPAYTYISALPYKEGAAGAPGPYLYNGRFDGRSFTIEGLPAGKFELHCMTYNSEPKLYVKSMSWNGRDLFRERLTLAEGGAVEGVEITFAPNPGELRVRVTDAEGRPGPNAVVFLQPAGATDLPAYAMSLACRAGGISFCTITAPPGDYQVGITQPGRARPASEEEMRRSAAGPRVSLRAGETKDLTLAVPEK